MGTGKIHPRAGLSEAQRAKIELEQFGDIWPQAKKLIEQHIIADGVRDVTRQIGSSVPYKPDLSTRHSLTIDDTCTILKDPKDLQFKTPHSSIAEVVLHSYVSIICEYVNEQRAQTSCLWTLQTSSNESLETPKFDDEFLQDLQGPAFAKGLSIFDVDYFFLPYSRTEPNKHYYLLGMAPKQEFFFAVDSCPMRCGTLDGKGARNLWLLAHATLGRTQQTTDSNQDIPNWPIYGSWAVPTDRVADESPRAPRQRDWYNCGVFTSTNAFCLAFGYNLMCYHHEDNTPGDGTGLKKIELMINKKRWMMAVELLQGGFTPPLEYDLIELPAAIEGLRPRAAPAPARPPVVDLLAPTDEEMDLNAFLGSNILQEGLTDARDEEFFNKTAFDPGWPGQFSSKHHQRAILYFAPSPSEKDYWSQLKTKKELLEGAQARGVRDYRWLAYRATKGNEEEALEALEALRAWCQNWCEAVKRWRDIENGVKSPDGKDLVEPWELVFRKPGKEEESIVEEGEELECSWLVEAEIGDDGEEVEVDEKQPEEDESRPKKKQKTAEE